MNIYFVRHAESEANVRNIISACDSEIHPLTQHGRQQANSLAHKLKDVEFVTAYSSDLLRAVQTTEIILQGRKIPYRRTPLLREHDAGVWEGRSDDEVWKMMHELFHEWMTGNLDARPESGESMQDMQDRFAIFLKKMLGQHLGRVDPILIVSHAGLFWSNFPFLFENIDFEFMLDRGLENASIIIAEITDGRWLCIEWDDCVLAP